MSSNIRETSVQLIQQRLTCPVCLDRYKKPKLLPCQHTFCLYPCLVNLIDRSTRRIKCPECRGVHIVPVQGVESYPNNITILGFLDLDFSRSMTNSFLDRCHQCTKKVEGLIKCLDCEKFFCDECRPSHLNQLKNETAQNVMALRKSLPTLSQKVGNCEQQKTLIAQNLDSLKREISSVINRLVEDLRSRERCLHAEAEVCTDAQLRINGLEKENAEIEFSSVSSFCDSSEQTLNRQDQDHHNQVALINKQCKNFADQMKSMTVQIKDLKKFVLTTTDLRDFSFYIQNFGNLTETNQNNTDNTNTSFQTIQNNLSDRSNNSQNFISTFDPYTNIQPRQRQTWDRTSAAIPYNYELDLYNSPRVIQSYSNPNTDRSIGARQPIQPPIQQTFQSPLQPSIAFNVGFTSGSLLRRQEHQPARIQSPRVIISDNINETIPAPPRLVRSNTFVIENENNENNVDSVTRSVDSTDLFNVRRPLRTKTPMTFNVMLNDENDQSRGLDSPQHFSTPSMPSIDYTGKTKAKLIIGKQGRENSEFVWPTDVSVNIFNGQILVADSGNHRVQIFEGNGKFVKTFGKVGNRDGQLNTVSGLFIDSMSNIFVVDRLNHRLQVFDRYCRFLRSIGLGEGKAPGQLNHPFSCCVNKISEIFVCDKENDRISVFHLSGKFLRAFGKLGPGRGQFDKPYYAHVTRDNLVLVSDCSNHRIQIFDSDGNYLNTFGHEGSEPGQMKHPRGITTDAEGFILVADSGNSRIQVFRPDNLEYVTHFGTAGTDSGKFRGLEGITVNHKNGDVIVCDKENHRVQIL